MPLAAVRTKRSSVKLPTDDSVAREVGLQKLLQSRICDLTLKVEDTLFDCLAQVTGELRAKGITFIPAYYLGDDDFWTADRATSVNVPWYLANTLLWQLVNDHLFEYSRDEVLMYLRHETGHAINYAFELWKRKDWTQTFGEFRRPYRDVYSSEPVEPRLRPLPPPRRRVPLRPEAPRRGLRRNLRGVARSRVALAPALQGLAGRAGQARIRRPHHRRRGRVPGHTAQPTPRQAGGLRDHQGDRRRLPRHRARGGSRSGRVPPRPARDLPSPLRARPQPARAPSPPRVSSSSTSACSSTRSAAGSATPIAG